MKHLIRMLISGSYRQVVWKKELDELENQLRTIEREQEAVLDLIKQEGPTATSAWIRGHQEHLSWNASLKKRIETRQNVLRRHLCALEPSHL